MKEILMVKMDLAFHFYPFTDRCHQQNVADLKYKGIYSGLHFCLVLI